MSLPSALLLSPDAKTTVQAIGAERTSVTVIDSFLADPQSAIALAAAMPFAPIGPYYPGVRASLGPDVAIDLAAALRDVIAASLGLSAPTWKGECYFSIVTATPASLMPIQRLPHFDGLEDTRIAALLYLATSDFGGTSFYRHRSTGFETVTAVRYPLYGASLKSDVERHGLPPPRFIGDGAPIFDEVANFDAAFNRLLLYRGNALHCSRIRNADALSADPRAGRLTLNLFLEPA